MSKNTPENRALEEKHRKERDAQIFSELARRNLNEIRKDLKVFGKDMNPDQLRGIKLQAEVIVLTIDEILEEASI